MGLYQIKCISCQEPFMWFSGNLDQRCDICQKNYPPTLNKVVENPPVIVSTAVSGPSFSSAYRPDLIRVDMTELDKDWDLVVAEKDAEIERLKDEVSKFKHLHEQRYEKCDFAETMRIKAEIRVRQLEEELKELEERIDPGLDGQRVRFALQINALKEQIVDLKEQVVYLKGVIKEYEDYEGNNKC